MDRWKMGEPSSDGERRTLYFMQFYFYMQLKKGNRALMEFSPRNRALTRWNLLKWWENWARLLFCSILRRKVLLHSFHVTKVTSLRKFIAFGNFPCLFWLLFPSTVARLLSSGRISPPAVHDRGRRKRWWKSRAIVLRFLCVLHCFRIRLWICCSFIVAYIVMLSVT